MKLFESCDLGGLRLSNRIMMAPLTRRRSTRDHVPVDVMVDYYQQRYGAGLIIAEGTSPSPNGVGYPNMPGLYNHEQLTAWKKVTHAVHQKGGKIFLQVMHTGRIGHPNNLPEDAKVLGPSPIAQKGEVSTYDFEKQAYPVPHEMTTTEIQTTIQEYVDCAKLSLYAGFDGIEIHGAHGYLPNQFINSFSNTREDEYGGNHENRMRFLLEIMNATCAAIGSEKVGLRISPFSYADESEDQVDLVQLYKELVDKLNPLNLAYLHLSHMGEAKPVKFELWRSIREIYHGSVVLCGDYTKDKAEEALQEGLADFIAFGRDFIANPDLVERLKNDWPLAERDRTHWYTIGAKGLSDYPTYK